MALTTRVDRRLGGIIAKRVSMLEARERRWMAPRFASGRLSEQLRVSIRRRRGGHARFRKGVHQDIHELRRRCRRLGRTENFPLLTAARRLSQPRSTSFRCRLPTGGSDHRSRNGRSAMLRRPHDAVQRLVADFSKACPRSRKHAEPRPQRGSRDQRVFRSKSLQIKESSSHICSLAEHSKGEELKGLGLGKPREASVSVINVYRR
jgi:hypothetical protein